MPWMILLLLVKLHMVMQIIESSRFLVIELNRVNYLFNNRILGFDRIWILRINISRLFGLPVIISKLIFKLGMIFLSTSESNSIRIVALNMKFDNRIICLWLVLGVVIFCAVGLMENVSKLHLVILKIYIS